MSKLDAEVVSRDTTASLLLMISVKVNHNRGSTETIL